MDHRDQFMAPVMLLIPVIAFILNVIFADTWITVIHSTVIIIGIMFTVIVGSSTVTVMR